MYNSLVEVHVFAVLIYPEDHTLLYLQKKTLIFTNFRPNYYRYENHDK